MAVVFTACNDEFLDRVPETSIGKENFFNTEEDLKIYINGLYNFPGVGLFIEDRATDNAATTGNMEIKTMMTSSPSSSTILSGWNWNQLRSINFFLENFQRAALSDEVLNHYEGVARLFRANFYMDKVKRYSDVPWYDQVIGSGDEEALLKKQDSREIVVDKLFEDYQFAAENVYQVQPSGAVDQWTVKAFMARAALYEGTFRKYHTELGLEATANEYLTMARDMAKDIMDNGGYMLNDNGNPTADYGSLFNSTDLGVNQEIILARVFEHEVLNSGWWEYMFGNYEVCPTKDLLQTYLMADGSYYSSQAGHETFEIVQEFANRDPRLNQTYAYPGYNLIFTSTYSQGGGSYVQQLGKNFSGYHQIKGFMNTLDLSARESIDIPVIRYAEMLLIYAEAKAELGELTQADLDITVNLIRDRAGMPPLNMSVVADPVQQARYPQVTSAVLLEIRRERRIEMALEGFRFDDLMRWNAGELLENEPEGLYFPGLGKFDLTGDGEDDIHLLPASESIPDVKETNGLGVQLIYYRAGTFGEDVGVYLKNGNSGTVQTIEDRGTFVAPKYYYRPVPQPQVTLNPNLEQLFGWE
ncbi:MAG: RagB/SusD family nutrient uptake outer membrane protein [Cyclobacteriaceae bacterium]